MRSRSFPYTASLTSLSLEGVLDFAIYLRILELPSRACQVAAAVTQKCLAAHKHACLVCLYVSQSLFV